MTLFKRVGPVCVCLSPCSKKCLVCGADLCIMTTKGNNCALCNEWYCRASNLLAPILYDTPRMKHNTLTIY